MQLNMHTKRTLKQSGLENAEYQFVTINTNKRKTAQNYQHDSTGLSDKC